MFDPYEHIGGFSVLKFVQETDMVFADVFYRPGSKIPSYHGLVSFLNQEPTEVSVPSEVVGALGETVLVSSTITNFRYLAKLNSSDDPLAEQGLFVDWETYSRMGGHVNHHRDVKAVLLRKPDPKKVNLGKFAQYLQHYFRRVL